MCNKKGGAQQKRFSSSLCLSQPSDTHFVMLNSTNVGNVFLAPKCLYVVLDVHT